MEGLQGQVNQLIETITIVLRQLNIMTNRLDQLEENRQAPRRESSRAQLPQVEPDREDLNTDHYQERERPRHPRPNLRPPHDDQDDYLLRLIKVEALSFDGSHQPSDYLN